MAVIASGPDIILTKIQRQGDTVRPEWAGVVLVRSTINITYFNKRMQGRLLDYTMGHHYDSILQVAPSLTSGRDILSGGRYLRS